MLTGSALSASKKSTATGGTAELTLFAKRYEFFAEKSNRG